MNWMQEIDRLGDQSHLAVSRLAELVAIPSPTGEEGEAQRLMASWLAEVGADVELEDPDLDALFTRYPEIAQYPTDHRHDLDVPYQDLPTLADLRSSSYAALATYDGRPNVWGTFRGEGGGRSLILNGHIDTVTPAPEADWSTSPYEPLIRSGRMYGRGTSDMKGGLVAALTAMTLIKDAGIVLAGDVIVQSVVNEEHSGNGTLDLVRRGVTADAAIVLEPTDRNIFVSTPGALYWRVDMEGVPRHPGARWSDGEKVGVSALELLGPVVEELTSLEHRFRKGRPSEAMLTHDAYFSVVLGMVSGGTYESVTAAHARLSGGLYFGPTDGTFDEIIQHVRSSIDRANGRMPGGRAHAEVSFLHHDDASLPERVLSSNVPFGMWLAGELRKSGPEPSVGPAPFACDARHLVNQGNIPTVVFGPGSIAQAHVADEYVELDSFWQACRQLAVAIVAWCGASATRRGSTAVGPE